MKLAGYLLCCFLLFNKVCAQETPSIRFHGLKVFVDDLENAMNFYENILGFSTSESNDNSAKLNTGAWPIYLEASSKKSGSKYPLEARTGASFQVHRLLPSIDAFRKKNILFYDTLLKRNGVGISIPFQDPSRNVMHLIEVQIRPSQPFNGVKIYNTGVTVSNMSAAVTFYEEVLGFEEWSRNYLPDALPLKHKDGSFAFMIHYREGLEMASSTYGESPQLSILMETNDLTVLEKWLNRKEVSYTQMNKSILLKDPEGNFVEILSN